MRAKASRSASLSSSSSSNSSATTVPVKSQQEPVEPTCCDSERKNTTHDAKSHGASHREKLLGQAKQPPDNASEQAVEQQDSSSQDEQSKIEHRNERGRHLWRPPSTGPVCEGIRGAVCTLALDGSGQPGAAKPSDSRCIFCSSERFEQLTWRRGGSLVTHYLNRLQQKDQQEALRIIGIHGGKAMRKDYAARLKRSQKRRNPARKKRGPRGRYSKKRQATNQADDKKNAAVAWGIPPVAATQRDLAWC